MGALKTFITLIINILKFLPPIFTCILVVGLIILIALAIKRIIF